MNKRMICTECPKGCSLSITIQDDQVISIRGNQCERGLHFAHHEVESPQRLLTSTVCAYDLAVKMVPVRTDRPIPKNKISEGMESIRQVMIDVPVAVGDIIIENFLDLDVNLIATRSVGES